MLRWNIKNIKLSLFSHLNADRSPSRETIGAQEPRASNSNIQAMVIWERKNQPFSSIFFSENGPFQPKSIDERNFIGYSYVVDLVIFYKTNEDKAFMWSFWEEDMA